MEFSCSHSTASFGRKIPNTRQANCAAFHPNQLVLAIDFKNGSIQLWDVDGRARVSTIKVHTKCIARVRFEPDGRLLSTSWDLTASIVKLDDHYNVSTLMQLKVHSNWVNDILCISSSNQCVTCSDDKTIKVWDCVSGECVHTLTEHTHYVTVLALHPCKDVLVSGSIDQTVIVWSSRTFETHQSNTVFQHGAVCGLWRG
jgi:WD40 repeat protein